MQKQTRFEMRLLERLNAGEVMTSIEDGRGRVGRVSVPAIAIRHLLSDGVIARDPVQPHYRITEAGTARLRRMAPPPSGRVAGDTASSPYARQHRDEQIVSRTEKGEAHEILVNLAESPLARLAQRRGKDGDVLITADQLLAGERLRQDFERAALAPKVTMCWSDHISGGSVASLTPGEIQVAARKRFDRAIAAVGPGLADILTRVCCLAEGMEAAERSLNWPRRSARLVLGIALDRLHAHYEGRAIT